MGDGKAEKVIPVWTLATRDVPTQMQIPGTEQMTPELLRNLRTMLAELADVPIATLEVHPLPANLSRQGGIHLESTSPLATQLSQLIARTPKAGNTAVADISGGEVLYRMVVPAKIADQVGKGLVKPMASKAVPGGVHSALTRSSKIAGQATFVPVAGKAGAAGAVGGGAVVGAGAVTIAAPLILMAVAVGVSAYADQQRQAAIENITELLEKLVDNELRKERSALNGCRDAIEKATAVLLDRGTVGASLGLDASVYAISTALANAEERLSTWQKGLARLGDGPVEITALQKEFPDIEKPESEFRAHLELASAAIAFKKRVLVLQAVEHAQMDKENPFESFVRALKKDERRVRELESGLADLLKKLSQLQLMRSKRFLDKHLLTSTEVDNLLSVTYKLREIGDSLPSEASTDIAIEIARDRDGSIVVFPAAPAA